MKNYFLLLWIATIIGSISANIPRCDYQDQTYVCQYVTNTFPKIFYGNYNLKCERCSIKIFSQHTFPYENSLISFNVSDSGIQHLSSGAFANLKNIQYLYLQNNRIMNVSRGAFAGLKRLYQVHLDNNLIADITPGFLSDLEANSVILANNKIKRLHENAFEGSIGLLSLNLENNHIKNIHKDSFAGLGILEYLELQNNQLCYLPLGLFKHLSYLRVLNLADNKLTRFTLGTFSGLRNLNALILANNSIQVFDGADLLPLRHLNKLDVSGNNIYYLDAHGIYSNSPSIRYLHIEDNIFSCSLLTIVLRHFKDKGVEIVNNRGRYDVQNIDGIACIDIIITEALPFDFFLKKVHEETKNLANFC